MPFTRRDFMKRGTLLLAMGVTAPTFLTRRRGPGRDPGRLHDRAEQAAVLVVMQLGGGNDTLNSVVPYADPTY